MPFWFDFAGLLMGTGLVTVGVLDGRWRPLTLGIVIIAIACIAIDGELQ